MSTLARINYVIAALVIVLGFMASYVTLKSNQAPEEEAVQEHVQPDEPVVPEPSQEILEAMPTKHPVPVKTVESAGEGSDWKFECQLSLEGMEHCSAFQQIYWKDEAGSKGDGEALRAVLLMAERAGQPTPRLQLIAPLGSFLPAGISMKLGEEEPFIVPFQFCDPAGCFVNLDLAPDVVDAMKKHPAMVVEYMGSDKRIATVDVSLKGVDGALLRIAQ